MKSRNVILIPAYNPSEGLLNYVKELISSGFENIMIINDGCNEKCKPLFEALSEMPEVMILNHCKNFGKGRGLKNGFNIFLDKFGSDENIKGIITVDSDGQHAVKDVVRISESLNGQDEPALILGARNFKGKSVPFKSKFGNIITAGMFHLMYGKKLMDTQTGLRGIPKELVYDYLDLNGERFEYETNMLIYTAVHKIPFEEVVIDTIYIDNNNETHFNPISDSAKIYYVLFKGFFKYIASSLASCVLDLLIFKIVLNGLYLGWKTGAKIPILLATVIARVVSSIFNFSINRNVVFKSQGNGFRQIAKYYILCIAQMLTSAGLVIALHSILSMKEVIIKILVDAVLFCISYQIQKRWVFAE